jgi:flagella basal body P-ring formation protein FlgA
VQIKSVLPVTPPARPAPSLDATDKDRIQQAVTTAIDQYLRDTVDRGTPWTVNVRLSSLAAERLRRAGCRFTVSGGSPPWTGSQRFVVSTQTDSGTVDVPVLAEVASPELVVVPTRAIPRGHIIRPTDVRLQPRQQNPRLGTAATRLEDVIGKETTRALAADRPIDQRAVQSPILVRRGEAVTVIVRVANVRVVTSGRAMESGSQGELIEVQALNSRERYLAQVSGVQEVAVYPRRVQVAASADEFLEQATTDQHQMRTAEPLVAVGHTPANAEAGGWTPRRSNNK